MTVFLALSPPVPGKAGNELALNWAGESRNPAPAVRLVVLSRHGRSLLNLEGVVNGDPRRDLGLAPEGIAEARELGLQLSALAIELAVVSPFPRAMQTADAALEGRDVPRLVDEELGDIRIGEPRWGDSHPIPPRGDGAWRSQPPLPRAARA